MIKWTEDEINFVLENALKMTKNKLKDELFIKFNSTRSIVAINHVLYRNKVKVMTPFYRHDYIYKNAICQELNITELFLDNLCKEKYMRIRPYKTDRNIFFSLNQYDKIKEFFEKHIWIQDAFSKYPQLNKESIYNSIKKKKIQIKKVGTRRYIAIEDLNKILEILNNYSLISDLAKKYHYQHSNIQFILNKYPDIKKIYYQNKWYIHKEDFSKVIKIGRKNEWTDSELNCLIDLIKSNSKYRIITIEFQKKYNRTNDAVRQKIKYIKKYLI